MLAGLVLTLVASTFVAAQTIPNIPAGTCVSQCSTFANAASACSQAGASLSCICDAYNKGLPGSCISCWNSADPAVGQALQQALSACNDPSVTSFLTGTIPAVTGFDTATFSTPTAAITSATNAAATTAGTTTSPTGTASAGKTSGAGKVEVVLVAAVMVAVFGGAFVGI